MNDSAVPPRRWAGPAAVAIVALGLTLGTSDPSNCRPSLPEGPGITLDEMFNVQQGVWLSRGLQNWATGSVALNDVFTVPLHNPDHPPLGRIWLGVFHDLANYAAPIEQAVGNDGRTLFVTAAARSGSAVAFSLTVFLIGWFAVREYGSLAGIAASTSLLLMPRVFGHAHLAALETITGLMWSLVVMVAACLWSPSRPPVIKTSLIIGGLIGLALLTKMQAIALPPMIAVWALWHWRWRAVAPVLVMLATSVVVFVAGWPWLWQDLSANLATYFGRATDRIELHTWYLGEVHQDVRVPWHYPWVMFLTTVPVGLHVLAAIGLSREGRQVVSDPKTSLVAGAVVAPLVLFSVPGVAVYDGARLFLISFPCWAIFAGAGTRIVSQWLDERTRRPRLILFALFVSQSIGLLLMHPFYLSYYNALAGGLRGAEAIGLEVNYWSDGISRTMIKQIIKHVPRGSELGVAPSMHPRQAAELRLQSPALQAHDIHPVGVDPKDPATRFAVFFHRQADLPDPSRLKSKGWVLRTSVTRQGVAVASLWEKTSHQR